MITFPTKKRPKNFNPHRLIGVFFGAEGTGKSTLASQFLDPGFIALEDGLAGIEAFEIEDDGERIVNWTWEKFREVVDALTWRDPKTKKHAHNFGTIVVDTLEELRKLAIQSTCELYNVSELGNKKQSPFYYTHVNAKLSAALDQLMSGDFGVVFLAHERMETVELRSGKVLGPMDRAKSEVIQRYCPGGKQAYKAVAARADYIVRVAFDPFTGKRILECSPGQHRIAKDRLGVLPESMDLDYGKFIECFREAYKSNKGGQENE